MEKRSVPFNIQLPTYPDKRLEGPNIHAVTSLDIFDGLSKNLHPEGLFSLNIFGRVGDKNRNYRFGKINIGVPIFHPVIYRAFISIRRFYGDIINGVTYAYWNDEIKDFVKSTAIDGKTGFEFFAKHCKDIELGEQTPNMRGQYVELLTKFKNCYFIDKVIVMPAGLRDIQIEADGRVSQDEINELYRKLLSVRNSISDAAIRNNPELINTSRFVLQKTMNSIYDLLERMISGKEGLMLGKWASRNIFNGTRNVVTSMNIAISDLDDKDAVTSNHTVVGLFQYLKGTLPLSKHSIQNSFLQKAFIGVNSQVLLVNKKTLKLEAVDLKPEYYDSWMSSEGLEKIINLYSEDAIRHRPIEIAGRYLGLIYRDPAGGFKMFQDIDDLPEGLDKKLVTPITLTELLYSAVYKDAKDIPALVTRYPITGLGSIYPSLTLLMPTVNTEKRYPMNDNWEIDDTQEIAPYFPITDSPHVNSFSPHQTKLDKLGMD